MEEIKLIHIGGSLRMSKNSTLLIVDSVENCQEKLKKLIEKKIDCGVVLASSGSQAIEICNSGNVDLILLVIDLPDTTGFEVCKELKSNSITRDISVVLLSNLSDEFSVSKGFNVGCVDYIKQPYKSSELVSRIKSHLFTKQQQDELRDDLKKMEIRNQELSILAKTDFLTGLSNRSHFLEQINIQLENIGNYNPMNTPPNTSPVSIVLCDIDNFKSINDRYGHGYGDTILKTVADTFKQMLRGQDLVARWGGEEFVLALVDTNSEGTQTVLSRIANKLLKTSNITLTFGVVLPTCSSDRKIEELLRKADLAMYRGKRNGKNQIVIYDTQIDGL
jgi:diguanylate cyclase (GGDEF)-like protein